MKLALLAIWLALPGLVSAASAEVHRTKDGACRSAHLLVVPCEEPKVATKKMAVTKCDHDELLSASREWAKSKRVFVLEAAGASSSKQLRDYADQLEAYERVDARLRKAVEECGP
jgi:hypothetical protein